MVERHVDHDEQHHFHGDAVGMHDQLHLCAQGGLECRQQQAALYGPGRKRTADLVVCRHQHAVATTLPSDTYGPASLLVVDISFTFRPLFAIRSLPGLAALNNITINRSFYTSPRYVTTVGYTSIGGDPGTTTVCT